MLGGAFLALALAAATARASPLYERAAPTVSTTDGSTFIGKSSGSVESFLGIPFAQAPVGNLRFAAPVARNGPLGTVDATRYGYACPQHNLLAGVFPGALDGIAQNAFNALTSIPVFTQIASSNASEDCLTINVQRPAGLSSTAKLPVMVYIFGGAFLLGGSSMYSGNSLVARSISRGQPVIYVSMNYRVSAFGFLPGKEVAADSSVATNAGLLDQRLAMEWVQQYIGNFGGDPDKVTVFGESAGAISIAFHIQAKDGDLSSERRPGKSLFRAAIMESGGPIPVEGPARGQASFDQVARAAGCLGNTSPIACLRAVPYSKLLAAVNTVPNILSYRSVSLPFLPRTDGKFLRSLTQQAMPAGRFARVPIISGNQYDEGTILALGTLNVTTSAQFSEWLRSVFFPNTTPAQRARMLELYPQDITEGSPFDTGIFNALTPQSKRINAIVGDVVFQVCRRFFLAFTSPVMPTWSYVSRSLGAVPVVGSFHGSDIISVFGLAGPTPLSVEMQSRWIAFANTLNPNIQGYINWPQYGASKNLLQFSDFPSKVIPDTYRKAGMDYLWSIVDSLTL